MPQAVNTKVIKERVLGRYCHSSIGKGKNMVSSIWKQGAPRLNKHRRRLTGEQQDVGSQNNQLMDTCILHVIRIIAHVQA
jgi:hypothetical protein